MHIIGVILTRIFLHRVSNTETGQRVMRPRWALIPVAMVAASFVFIKVAAG
jgi:hypothetical protein